MSHYRMPVLAERGFVVLDREDRHVDPREWLDLEYVDFKSGGDTRFAPIASSQGEVECMAFWHAVPPRGDTDGVLIPSQVEIAPTLARRVRDVGANFGRARVIELQPNSYADAIYNAHRDDNNRLNPDGAGWIVRCFMNLTDDDTSYLVLREDITDPGTETRIALPAGAQVIVDSQRLWHAVWHPGPALRYCLITSFESGPQLQSWIDQRHPRTEVFAPELDSEVARGAHELAMSRRALRAEHYGFDPSIPPEEL